MPSTFELQRRLENAMKSAQQSGDQLQYMRRSRRGNPQEWNETQDRYDDCKQEIHDLRQALYRMPGGDDAIEAAYSQFLRWKDAYSRGGGWNGVCQEDESDWLH